MPQTPSSEQTSLSAPSKAEWNADIYQYWEASDLFTLPSLKSYQHHLDFFLCNAIITAALSHHYPAFRDKIIEKFTQDMTKVAVCSKTLKKYKNDTAFMAYLTSSYRKCFIELVDKSAYISTKLLFIMAKCMGNIKSARSIYYGNLMQLKISFLGREPKENKEILNKIENQVSKAFRLEKINKKNASLIKPEQKHLTQHFKKTLNRSNSYLITAAILFFSAIVLFLAPSFSSFVSSRLFGLPFFLLSLAYSHSGFKDMDILIDIEKSLIRQSLSHIVSINITNKAKKTPANALALNLVFHQDLYIAPTESKETQALSGHYYQQFIHGDISEPDNKANVSSETLNPVVPEVRIDIEATNNNFYLQLDHHGVAHMNTAQLLKMFKMDDTLGQNLVDRFMTKLKNTRTIDKLSSSEKTGHKSLYRNFDGKLRLDGTEYRLAFKIRPPTEAEIEAGIEEKQEVNSPRRLVIHNHQGCD